MAKQPRCRICQKRPLEVQELSTRHLQALLSPAHLGRQTTTTQGTAGQP